MRVVFAGTPEFARAALERLHAAGFEVPLEMLAAVPGLKLVFDTGNPGITPDFRQAFPYPNQDVMECYARLRGHIAHVHIKDGVRDPATGKEQYFFPDEGKCEVATIVKELFRS